MTVLEDRIVQFPNRYKMVLVEGTTDTFDLVPVPGEVTAEGVWVSKQNVIDTANAEAHKVVFEDYKTARINLFEVEPLSVARDMSATATIAQKAIIAGGITNATLRNTVDIYDEYLIRTTGTVLQRARALFAGVANNGRALFAGGSNNDTTKYADVDVFDENLIKTSAPALSAGRSRLGGAWVGKYILFAGGMASSASSVVDAYDDELIRTTAANLSWYGRTCGASIGTSAILASEEKTVDAYDSNLIKTSLAPLPVNMNGCRGNNSSQYALFCGGGTTAVNNVVAYDANLIQVSAAPMSITRASETHGVGCTQDVFLISGGNSKIVDCYDDNLIKVDAPELPLAVRNNVVATTGTYFLSTSNYANANVYVHDLNGVANINIPPYYAYKFQEHTQEQFALDGITYSCAGAANGYIKPGNKTLIGLNI